MAITEWMYHLKHNSSESKLLDPLLQERIYYNRD